jgi:hypothetical protein
MKKSIEKMEGGSIMRKIEDLWILLSVVEDDSDELKAIMKNLICEIERRLKIIKLKIK